MRITGGVYRSRTLIAPRGQETRPTSDRVREALFSMISSNGMFAGAHFDKETTPDADEDQQSPLVLDLYAGSGALGLEALSRGAREVVFVESARPAITAIRENVRALGVDEQVTLLSTSADRALSQLLKDGEQRFDLILVDPPYADVDTTAFTEIILTRAARLLAASGIFVLEHSSKSEEPAPPTGLVVDRRRQYGDTTLSLFRYS
jgi:16S rRNA (guanine966-N2)-methyltransferase